MKTSLCIAAILHSCLGALVLLTSCPRLHGADASRIASEARERGLREIDAALKSEQELVAPLETERLFDGAPLTLAAAVELAIANDRNLKWRRDQMILCATDIQRTRRTYFPVFRGSISGGYNETMYFQDAWHDGNRRTASDQSLGFSQKVPGGGSLNVDAGGGLSQADDSSWGYSARMNASLNIPILRGAGMDYYYEALVAGKRGLVYQLRDYRQQRDRVALEIIDSFLQCTSLKVRLQNSREKQKTFQTLESRARTLWAIGAESEFEVLRTRQNVLYATDEIRGLETQIANTLESMKLRLGIPQDTALELVDCEVPDHEFQMDAAATVDATLSRRLDLKTAAEVVSDRNRATGYAQRDMLPVLDLNLHAGSWNDNVRGNGNPVSRDAGASIRLELPLDRSAERSRLYSTAFSLIQSQRDLENARETVVVDIRNGVRNLQTLEQSMKTVAMLLGVEQRRVVLAGANYERGMVSNRDVLETSANVIGLRNWELDLKTRHFVGVLRLENDAGLFNANVFIQQMTNSKVP